MGQIVWRDQMAVGIKEIDDDHKNLVHYINRAEELIEAAPFRKGHMAQVILDLIRYTRVHFEREERLMQRIIFPDAGAHQDSHARFAAELYDIGERYQANPTVDTAREVYDLMARWVIEHLVRADREIINHLQRRGGANRISWRPENPTQDTLRTPEPSMAATS
ncbi:MAG: bacteriohemerythrin [Rhodospirillaceae bacterium]